MKMFKTISTVLLAGLVLFTSMSCVSVDRVDADKDIQLSGYWSDTDVKIVCEDIIDQVLKSPRVANFKKEYGRVPVVTISDIRNESDEYIDTEIIADKLKYAILNSGKLEFMANRKVRDDLRDEIADQADHAKADQAKEFDNEDAADFALSGSVKTMVDRSSRQELRTTIVTIELNDIESGRTVGIFQPSEDIRKMITGKRR